MNEVLSVDQHFIWVNETEMSSFPVKGAYPHPHLFVYFYYLS